MANLNKVFLIGNLTRDPELRYTPNGMAVTNLRLAVNHRFKDRSGEARQDTCFINVVVWDKQAESCNQYLGKGRLILVEGRLQQRSWQDSEGKNKSVIEVRADRVVFLGAAQKQTDSKDNVELESDKVVQSSDTINEVSWPQDTDEQLS